MLIAVWTIALAGQTCAGANDVAASAELGPLLARAQQSRVVVIGEVHRTRGAPALLTELLEPLYARGFDVLAIEGAEDRQVVVEQFLAGTEEAGVLREAYLTPEIADALVAARALSRAHPARRPWRVLLVDGPSAWNVSRLEQTRDQRMFGRIRAVLDEAPQQKVLAYVGNTHTTEGVRLRDTAEGPGHTLDAIPIEIDPLGQLLDLYTAGRSLSVRTVGPDDALGAQLKKRFPRMTRLVIAVDGSPIAQSTGCIDPGGSFNAALRSAALATFVDVVVVVPEHGVSRGWPPRP